MTYTGWRTPTPVLTRADDLADAGERASVSRSRAIVAVKRVAAAIGAKAGDMLLLDILVAFTRPQDWEEGARPLAWPSNAYLLDQTGLSLSALKRRSRRLCALGLITYKDSPNGKRYGHRDSQGHIVEAYGFDLSPLSARVDEFEALHGQLVRERAERDNLRRTITVARRSIRAFVETAVAEGLSGPWRAIESRLEALLASRPGTQACQSVLSRLCAMLEQLRDEAAQAFRLACEPPETQHLPRAPEVKMMTEMNPTGSINEPHIPITTESPIVRCKGDEKSGEGGAANARQPQIEPCTTNQTPHSQTMAEQMRQTGTQVELATVMAACPAFTDMAHGVSGHVGDWRTLVGVAGKVRPMIGISADAWETAQKTLGAEVAAAALALITDKYSAGEVTSPGGYLRGLLAKAQKGELHLARSFHGRLGQAGSRG